MFGTTLVRGAAGGLAVILKRLIIGRSALSVEISGFFSESAFTRSTDQTARSTFVEDHGREQLRFHD